MDTVSPTFCGHTQLRTLAGWKLISIPYWEWSEICNDASGGPTRLESRKHTYLQKLLNGAVLADL
jgi:hypothetical protein